jgi:hypothetical protein
MDSKKIPVKNEFPEEPEKFSLPLGKQGLTDDQKVFSKLNEKLWIELSYDLLQVPTPLERALEQKELVPEEPEIEPLKRKTGPQKTVTRPQKLHKTGYSGRTQAENPAPPSRDFEPDWYDSKTGVEYSLAIEHPFVEERKRENKSAIVFWARARGTMKDGRPRRFPLVHEKVELVDIEEGKVVGYGYTSECFFTRKRVMGVVILRSLYWDPKAPLYVK